MAVAALAGCGGKDVTGTNPPAGKGVQKVEITPNNAVVKPGGFVQLAAAVTRNPGVSDAVTWSSSATGVATVDASGKVTAVANGSATITATSTVDPTVAGTAVITVRPLQAAQISIVAINQSGTNTSVNANNVSGQIDVLLNVDPGDDIVTTVELLVNDSTVASVNLSVRQSQQLSHGAVHSSLQFAPPIQLSFNTASFNSTTGSVSFKNGNCTLKARARTAAGTQSGSNTETLTLVNPDVIVGSISSARTAVNPTTGLSWHGGDVTISALPVLFTAGRTMASGNVTFGSGACDGSPTASARALLLSAPTPGGSSKAWTARLVGTGTPDPSNVAGYQSKLGCGGSNVTGDAFTVNAVDGSGQTIFSNAAPVNSASIRILVDNLAPDPPRILLNVNGRANGWVNDLVSFVTVNGPTNPNGMIAAPVTDAGVGGVAYSARVGTSLSAALASPDVTNAAGLPQSSANAYCVVLRVQDALGNSSPNPATCDAPNATLIGVDRTPPILNFSPTASLPDNARRSGTSIGGEFVLNVTDPGSGGSSGLLQGSPVKFSLTRRTASGTTMPDDCVGGTAVSGACIESATGLTVTLPTVSTGIKGINVAGYYTFTATAFDAAGNTSAVKRVIVFDGTAPTLTAPSVSSASNFYSGGVSQKFPALANDNLDLWAVGEGLTYPPEVLNYLTDLNGFNATPLRNSNVAIDFTIPFFYRQMQVVTANGPIIIGPPAKPTGIVGTLIDQANNVRTASATIPPNSIVTGNAAAYPGAGPTLMNSWSVTNAPATIGNGTGSTTPTSITLTAVADGPSTTFQPPFTRVDFHVLNGGVLQWIGTAGAPITTDTGASANGRKYTWTFAWAPGTNFATGAIYAIGSTADGDALTTPPGATLTIKP